MGEQRAPEARLSEDQEKFVKMYHQLLADEDKTTQSFLNGLKSISEINEIKQLLQDGLEDQVKTVLSEAKNLTEGEFLEKITEVLSPITKLRDEQPMLFENIQRDAFESGGGFTRLNERMSYGLDNGMVHIHLAPSRTVKEKLPEIFADGMQKLAEIIKNDESIKEVVATSWLVASEKYGPMIEALFGKENITDISDESREKFFKGEDRPIKKAVMNREKFLEMFGRKE